MLYIVELAEHTKNIHKFSKQDVLYTKYSTTCIGCICDIFEMHLFKYTASSKSKIEELGGLDVGWLVKDDMATTDTVQQNFTVLFCTDHNSKVWEV